MKKIFLLLSVAMGLSYNAKADNCDGRDCDCLDSVCFMHTTDCGYNCSWSVDDSGTLKIWATDSKKSGTMALFGFDYSMSYDGKDVWFSTPWDSYGNTIKAVEISGISNVGDYAFTDLNNLESFTADETLSSIGDYAFASSYSLRSVDLPNVNYVGKYAFDNLTLSYIRLADNAEIDDIFSLESTVHDCIRQGNRTCGSCGDKYVKSGTGCVAECGEGYTANSGTMQCVKNADPETPSVADEIEEAENDEEAIISACYKSGKVYYKGECLNEYPFARKHWTPAEAAKYLKDDDNEIIITFKK